MIAAEQIVNHIRTTLAPLANAEQAQAMSDYQRAQFPFLGIPATTRRAAVGKHAAKLAQEELLEVAANLWSLPEREYKYSAIDLLVQAQRRLDETAIPTLLELALREPWWDTVDALAGVIGAIVRKHREAGQAAMDAALTHESLWIRRIAMLHQRGWRLETDEARLYRYALALAHETDFFIRKAVGWALRDYAHWNPQAVARFLGEHEARFAPLTLREARKHIGA